MKVRIPTGRCFLGSYDATKPGVPQTQDTLKAAVTDREIQIGRTLDIDVGIWLVWHRGQSPDPVTKNLDWRARWDFAAGRIPMVTMDVGPLAEIAAGKWDSYFVGLNTEFLDLASPVIFRFAAEMDRSDLADLVGGPTTYTAAWNHVHDIVDADNVSWCWCIDAGATSVFDAYYPGDAVVDWIAADGYNWSPGVLGSQWRLTPDIFSAWYSWAIANHPGKPLMISETGCQEDPADPYRKAAWIDNVFTTLRTWPSIKAWVYFDSAPKYPWWLDSSPQAMTAFTSLAHRPHMKPKH